MTIAVGLVLMILAFAFIIYPFYRQRFRPVVSGENDRHRELLSRRDTSYSMLKELEFDYASGILTEEDYRDLEARYKRKAINVLREMDGLKQASPVEDEIEKRVRQLRRKQGDSRSAESEIERQVRQLRHKQGAVIETEDELSRDVREPGQRRVRFCSQCGTKLREGDKFCSSCGAKLS